MTKKYAVHILYDETPENPFEAWDSEPPILVAHWDRGQYSLTEYGLADRCPDIPEAVVRKRWKEMLAALNYGVFGWVPPRFNGNGYTQDWAGLRKFADDHRDYSHLWEALAEEYEAALELYETSDRLAKYAEVYEWLGCPAYVGSTSGCSQGDYAEVLVVWTKEWMGKVGINHTMLTLSNIELDQKNTVKLYGAWVWGNVYGWAITRSTEEQRRQWAQNTYCFMAEAGGIPCFYWSPHAGPGDVVESCWGYYGTDHEESGLLPEARAMVELLHERDQHEAEERSYWEAREVMTEGE